MNPLSIKVPSFKDQIYIAHKQLTPEFCKHCIGKFESDPTIYPGQTFKGHDVAIKQSDDVMISRYNRWNQEDQQISTVLTRNVTNFTTQFRAKFPWWTPPVGLHDTGYQMQRTVPNGFYTWHNDFETGRWYTFIFYLNDVKHKGYTEFIDGTKIKPTAGKLLLFPANTLFEHRGVSPVNEIKYLITGWLHTPFDGDPRIQGSWKEKTNTEVTKEHPMNSIPENRFGAEDPHITLFEDEPMDPEDPNNNVQMVLN